MKIDIKYLKGYKNELSNDENSLSFRIDTNMTIEKHMLKTTVNIEITKMNEIYEYEDNKNNQMTKKQIQK